mgnify:CR=1 FL=1
MSRTNQPSWSHNLEFVVVAVLIFIFASIVYISNRKSKESVDISFAPILFSDLRRIADKNNCGTEGVLNLRLGASWQKMFMEGKATKEECDAVFEFEDALDSLSEAMEKINCLPDLWKRLRF